jgi:WD40 repeat protein
MTLPDGKLLVHGSDNLARVYDVFTGKEVGSFSGHEGAILAVAISNDGKYAATASTDTTVLLWQLPSALKPGDLVRHFPENPILASS